MTPATAPAVPPVPPLPPDLNVLDPARRADPFTAYRRLRQRGPVHRLGEQTYLVVGHRDCAQILQDPAWGHGYSAGINPFRPGVPVEELPGSFLLLDPPEHTRLRGLVSRAFTARTVAALRPRVTAIVDGLLDGVLGAGEVDLVEAFAHPVPLVTISEMLGVPAADRAVFGGWAQDISRGLDPDALLTDAELSARAFALSAFHGYFAGLLADRRARPGQAADLLEALAGVEQMTEKEILDVLVLLLIAGFETTMNLIAGGVLALCRNPDQLALLRAEPGLVPAAVEEMLRYDTPVPFPNRVALQDVDAAGHRFRRGSGVLLLLGAANRDPAAYADPDRFDVTRFSAAHRNGGLTPPRHLAFSLGPHFCLGAPLARLEAEIAFSRLLRRTADITVTTEHPAYRDRLSMRGLAALPARLTPA